MRNKSDDCRYCIKGNGEEVQVVFPATRTATGSGVAPLPTEYVDCHSHESALWCMTPDGKDEFEMRGENAAAADDTQDSHDDAHGDAAASGGENCHFHAGVE